MYKITLTLFCFCCSILIQAKTFRTEPLSGAIKTLQVFRAENQFFPPIIENHTDETILVAFDYLVADYKDLSYKIIHCDADWQPSSLSEIEYLDGFNNNPIRDYAPSFNTFVSYFHYRISFPNPDCQFKTSGNYAVVVYDDFNPDQPLLRACFMVSQSKIGIEGKVSSNTDKSFNKELHQVSFTLNASALNIASPQSELKPVVRQNNRFDNQATELIPAIVSGKYFVYEHNPKLIFEAGNEYRRFEMTSRLYADPKIESYKYYKPYYHTQLYPDGPRTVSYNFDRDQNGGYLVRYADALDDSHTEADYYLVHFSFPRYHWYDGSLFLNGELVNNLFNENSKMEYNLQTESYEKTLLLKQGHINYQYLFVREGTSFGTPTRTEGNWWETENEYLILVYHRPFGERADRLIGYLRIQSNP